jgi:hypothetical protein
VLDNAAEALAAFQEQFDHATGQRNNDTWLIDAQVAEKLDELSASAEVTDGAEELDAAEVNMQDQALGLFQTSTFLELSERFFMNQGAGDTWHTLAAEDETPAMTMEVLEDLYGIVVNLCRRVIQSSIFIAKSRIRASTFPHQHPQRLVRHEDVVATLDILDMERNANQYWIGLARRSKFTVGRMLTPEYGKAKGKMSYDEVEEYLSRRGYRSSSAFSDASSHGSSAASADANEEDEASDSAAQSVALSSPGSGNASSEDGVDDRTFDQEEGDESGSDVPMSDVRDPSPHTTLPPAERGRLLEEEQDDYMEHMDQTARRTEESRLMEFLGHENEADIKEEDVEEPFTRRPRTMRKTLQDAQGWSVTYQAEWETYGHLVPRDNFAIESRKSKKRRTH